MRALRRLGGMARSLLRLNRTRHLAETSHVRVEVLEREIIKLRQSIDDSRLLQEQGWAAMVSKTDVLRDTGHTQNQVLSRSLTGVAAQVDLLERLMRPSPNGGQDQLPARKTTALLDAFYVALEARFRGDLSDIGARQEIYLPDVAEARKRTGGGAALDLGCGRGEWLALLEDNGIEACGVDTNEGQLAAARERGLAVIAADGLQYLRDQPDAHFAAVTAFHLFEHLPFAELAEWLVEIQRILKPGGVLIAETPNPENILVGAYSFHLDPTHTRPLPSGVLALLCETIGFSIRDVRLLHPHAHLSSQIEHLPETTAYLLYGYQDYGLIAEKAAGEKS